MAGWQCPHPSCRTLPLRLPLSRGRAAAAAVAAVAAVAACQATLLPLAPLLAPPPLPLWRQGIAASEGAADGAARGPQLPQAPCSNGLMQTVFFTFRSRRLSQVHRRRATGRGQHAQHAVFRTTAGAQGVESTAALHTNLHVTFQLMQALVAATCCTAGVHHHGAQPGRPAAGQRHPSAASHVVDCGRHCRQVTGSLLRHLRRHWLPLLLLLSSTHPPTPTPRPIRPPQAVASPSRPSSTACA